jgi:dTMP kinase
MASTQKFIAIEGLEGAGKSTVIAAVKSFFDGLNGTQKAIFTREPGGTFLAEKIRGLLIEKFTQESLCSESELLLMYASRLQHVKKLIEPALDKGFWVISDRFNWSSMAYQGGGRSLSLEQVKRLDDVFLSACQPGLVLYLDVPPEVGLARIQVRQNIDRFEEEKVEFFNRAREIYLQLCQRNDHAIRIDAAQSEAQVEKDVLGALTHYLRRSLGAYSQQ